MNMRLPQDLSLLKRLHAAKTEQYDLRRIGVIGDVHACDERLTHLIGFFQGQELDQLVCVGDVVNGPGDPNACAALLDSAGVITVRGNHDRWLLEGQVPLGDDVHQFEDLEPSTIAFLRALPVSLELRGADGTPLLLCHGLLDNDMNSITADDYGYALETNNELQTLLGAGERIVIKGHRHRPAIWRLKKLTLIDAGCLLAYNPTCGVIIDIAAGTVTPIALRNTTVELADPHVL
jgi:predicted phosphodiesterase